MSNIELTIPAAFYDIVADLGRPVPLDLEIIHKGKGKQYVILRADRNLPDLIASADNELAAKSPRTSAARSLLLSLRKQGVKLDLQNVLNVGEAKPVTRRTAAKATGRDYNRELIVTVTPRGDLILRPVGRRQAEQVALSDVYAWAQRNRCLKIARDKAADRAAARKAKRATRR